MLASVVATCCNFSKKQLCGRSACLPSKSSAHVNVGASTTPHAHGVCSTTLNSHDHSHSFSAISDCMCVSTEPAPVLPQLSALMGVPYSDLGPWLDSVSASSPQLPQQWPTGQADHPSSQLQAQQLISLAAFAAADAGKVTCNRSIPLTSCL